MTTNGLEFQSYAFDPDLPRPITPPIITALYRGYGADKTLDWELRRRLEPIYTILLNEPKKEDCNLGFEVKI